MSASPWRIRVVDEVEDHEWDSLVSADPRSTLFQHPRWLRRYVRHHPHKDARWLEARDSQGELQAGLPFVRSHRLGMRAIASGVAGCYGGPVRRPSAEGAEAMLMERYRREGGWRTVLREMLWGNEDAPEGAAESMLALESATMEVDGDNPEQWRKLFNKNRRNESHRSLRRGLITEVGRDPRWLDDFFPLYRRRSAEWRSRALPEAFLRELLEEEPAVLLARASCGGQQVGLHICFHLGSQLMAWLGTSERLQYVFPATMLIRQDLILAGELGCSRLNLGGSLGLEGVARFKEQMGSKNSRVWLLRQEAAWLRRIRGR